MKNILIISVALLTVLACKKKEEPKPAGPEQWAVGYWTMTDLEVSGNVDIAGTPIPLSGEGKNYVGGFQLNSNKTGSFDFSCDIDLIIPGIGTQTIPYAQSGSGTWTLINNNTELEIKETGGPTTIYPIKVITETIMILEQDSTFNMGGFSGTLNYEVTLKK